MKHHQEIFTCSTKDDAASAARRMRDVGVGALVVVEDGRPVGMVTDRDIVVRTLAKGLDPNDTRVADVMTTPLVTAPEDILAFDASEVMKREGIRRLPLVDANGDLAGIFTADALIGVIGGELSALAQAVQKGLRRGAAPAGQHHSIFGRE